MLKRFGCSELIIAPVEGQQGISYVCGCLKVTAVTTARRFPRPYLQLQLCLSMLCAGSKSSDLM